MRFESARDEHRREAGDDRVDRMDMDKIDLVMVKTWREGRWWGRWLSIIIIMKSYLPGPSV